MAAAVPADLSSTASGMAPQAPRASYTLRGAVRPVEAALATMLAGADRPAHAWPPPGEQGAWATHSHLKSLPVEDAADAVRAAFPNGLVTYDAATSTVFARGAPAPLAVDSAVVAEGLGLLRAAAAALPQRATRDTPPTLYTAAMVAAQAVADEFGAQSPAALAAMTFTSAVAEALAAAVDEAYADAGGAVAQLAELRGCVSAGKDEAVAAVAAVKTAAGPYLARPAQFHTELPSIFLREGLAPATAAAVCAAVQRAAGAAAYDVDCVPGDALPAPHRMRHLLAAPLGNVTPPPPPPPSGNPCSQYLCRCRVRPNGSAWGAAGSNGMHCAEDFPRGCDFAAHDRPDCLCRETYTFPCSGGNMSRWCPDPDSNVEQVGPADCTKCTDGYMLVNGVCYWNDNTAAVWNIGFGFAVVSGIALVYTLAAMVGMDPGTDGEIYRRTVMKIKAL